MSIDWATYLLVMFWGINDYRLWHLMDAVGYVVRMN